MKIETLIKAIESDYFVGVPDSQLKPLCDYLMARYGIDSKHHIIAANEGNAVGIAAGYHLATGKVPVVYMQNSGEGNALNPLVSLACKKVFGIPMILIIGWRGEPGMKDEPQHAMQGEITLRLLEMLDIPCFIVDTDVTPETVQNYKKSQNNHLEAGGQIAFVVKKNALKSDIDSIQYVNTYTLKREDVLKEIVKVSGEDIIVSTTGKTSRELFEIREANDEGHERDFLTVGSMGHASSIALGIALQQPDKRIWCIDGDGAALMHMGSMGTIGKAKPHNLVHIIINNGAHESVGGLPTAADNIDLCMVAKACGYSIVKYASNIEQLCEVLKEIKNVKELAFMEIKTAIGSRHDLGRPTITPKENEESIMRYLKGNGI